MSTAHAAEAWGWEALTARNLPPAPSLRLLEGFLKDIKILLDFCSSLFPASTSSEETTAACLSLVRFREQQSIVCWCQRLCSFNPYLSRETRRSWRAFVQPRRASDTLEDFSNHKYVWQERAAHKSTDTRWLTVMFFLMPVSLKAGRSYITRGRLRPDARKSRCGGTKRESRSGMIFRHQSTISIYKY